MNIVDALKQEERTLEEQLGKVQRAIAALNSRKSTSFGAHSKGAKAPRRRRGLTPAGRAKLSQLAKARWARIRAERAETKLAKSVAKSIQVAKANKAR